MKRLKLLRDFASRIALVPLLIALVPLLIALVPLLVPIPPGPTDFG